MKSQEYCIVEPVALFGTISTAMKTERDYHLVGRKKYQIWKELRDMQVKEQWSWFKYSQFNDLNGNLRVSWWKWSILLVTRTQQQPSLAEQQLCPRLLFLCSAITPALVSGKPAPVSLAVQSMALIQRQTPIKREHYSAVTATSSSAFPILLRRQRIHAREVGTCTVHGRSTAVC